MWFLYECFLLMYREVEFLPFFVLCFLFSMYKFKSELFLACAAITHLENTQTKGGILILLKLMDVLLLRLLWPKLHLWFGELIQNFHSPYQVSIKTILMLNTHFFQFVCPGITA